MKVVYEFVRWKYFLVFFIWGFYVVVVLVVIMVCGPAPLPGACVGPGPDEYRSARLPVMDGRLGSGGHTFFSFSWVSEAVFLFR